MPEPRVRNLGSSGQIVEFQNITVEFENITVEQVDLGDVTGLPDERELFAYVEDDETPER